MKMRPMLFSGSMVRAILAGEKWQTRRVVDRPVCFESDGASLVHPGLPWLGRYGVVGGCPFGAVGDRLWVRESCFPVGRWKHAPLFAGVVPEWLFRADYVDSVGREGCVDKGKVIGCHKWVPSIHMPREACRLVLEIINLRIERLTEISRGDAMAEGCPFANVAGEGDPRVWFQGVWEGLNGMGSFEANPLVWVVEFQIVELGVGVAMERGVA